MSQGVVVIGDALIDELRDDHGVREFVGGAGLNVAVGLSRLGVETTLIAMIGDDEAGGRIRSYLADYGVAVLATRSRHGSSRAVSIRSAGGEPQYQFNHAASERWIEFGEAERQAMAQAAVVAVSCFPFDKTTQTEDLMDAWAAGDALLAIDANPRAGMLHDRAEFVRGFEQLVPQSALIKVGDDDAQLLYGQLLEEIQPHLATLGPAAMMSTQGAAGARIDTDSVARSQPISPLPGRIIDTMGAGDASFATAVAALSRGMPEGADTWGAILHEAMDNAAATCRFEGALLRRPAELSAVDHADSIGT